MCLVFTLQGLSDQACIQLTARHRYARLDLADLANPVQYNHHGYDTFQTPCFVPPLDIMCSSADGHSHICTCMYMYLTEQNIETLHQTRAMFESKSEASFQESLNNSRTLQSILHTLLHASIAEALCCDSQKPYGNEDSMLMYYAFLDHHFCNACLVVQNRINP